MSDTRKEVLTKRTVRYLKKNPKVLKQIVHLYWKKSDAIKKEGQEVRTEKNLISKAKRNEEILARRKAKGLRA